MKREIELPDWRGMHQTATTVRTDRANHVRPLAEAYRDHFAPGDPLESAIVDLIADLLHLHAGLESNDRCWDGDDYIDVLARAQSQVGRTRGGERCEPMIWSPAGWSTTPTCAKRSKWSE